MNIKNVFVVVLTTLFSFFSNMQFLYSDVAVKNLSSKTINAQFRCDSLKSLKKHAKKFDVKTKPFQIPPNGLHIIKVTDQDFNQGCKLLDAWETDKPKSILTLTFNVNNIKPKNIKVIKD